MFLYNYQEVNISCCYRKFTWHRADTNCGDVGGGFTFKGSASSTVLNSLDGLIHLMQILTIQSSTLHVSHTMLYKCITSPFDIDCPSKTHSIHTSRGWLLDKACRQMEIHLQWWLSWTQKWNTHSDVSALFRHSLRLWTRELAGGNKTF